MKIYFGAVKEDDLFDTTCMFASPDNDEHYFYYGVEYGTNPGGLEEVTIFDGAGRSVPIDMENVGKLIDILTVYERAYKLIKHVEAVAENLQKEGVEKSHG